MKHLILNMKSIIVFVALLSLNIVFYILHIYGECKNEQYYPAIMQEVIETNDDSEAAISRDDNEKRIVTICRDKLEYVNTYRDYVSSVIANADKMSSFSIFQSDTGEASANIIKTGNDYKRIEDVEVSFSYDRPAYMLYTYRIGTYIVMAVMLVILYSFIRERNAGVWKLNYISKYGRAALGAKKLAYIYGLSLITTAVATGSQLLVTLTGFKDKGWISLPVQNLELCMGVTERLTLLQYYLKMSLYTWLVIATIVSVVWLFMVLIRQVNLSVIFVGLVFIIEYILYKRISAQSWLHILRDVNLFKFLEIEVNFSTYKNIVFAGYIFSAQFFTVIVLVLICIICSVITVLLCKFMRPEKNSGVIAAFLDKLSELHQKMLQGMPFIIKELYKMLFSCKGIITIIVMIILALYFREYGYKVYSQERKSLDEIYMAYGGSDYTGIINIVETAKSELEEALKNQEELGELYNEGLADLRELSEGRSEVLYYSSKYSKLSELEENLEYLAKLKEEKNIDGYMMSDKAYELLFGDTSKLRECIMLIILVVGTSVIVCQNYFVEKTTNMSLLLNTSRNGRIRLLIYKFLVAILVLTLLFIVIYYIDISRISNTYGFMYFEAPLQSLSFMENSNKNISIKDYFIIKMCIKYVIGVIGVIGAFVTSRIMIKTNNPIGQFVMVIIMVLGLCAGTLGCGAAPANNSDNNLTEASTVSEGDESAEYSEPESTSYTENGQTFVNIKGMLTDITYPVLELSEKNDEKRLQTYLFEDAYGSVESEAGVYASVTRCGFKDIYKEFSRADEISSITYTVYNAGARFEVIEYGYASKSPEFPIVMTGEAVTVEKDDFSNVYLSFYNEYPVSDEVQWKYQQSEAYEHENLMNSIQKTIVKAEITYDSGEILTNYLRFEALSPTSEKYYIYF